MTRIRFSSERGVSLPELLITMVLLSIGLAALLSLLDSSQAVQSKDLERGVALEDAQAGLGRMTREMRQGSAPITGAIPTAPGNILDLATNAGEVKYDCSQTSPTDPTLHACYRSFRANPIVDANTPPFGAPTLVIDRVSNAPADPIFTPRVPLGGTGVNFVEVKLVVPARGTRTVGRGYAYQATFTSGLYLRNS